MVTVIPILTPFITTNVNSNVRGGPGTVYDIQGELLRGQTADILGSNNSRTWWVIVFEAAPGVRGWIADSIFTGTYADGEGSLSATVSENRLTGTWSTDCGAAGWPAQCLAP